MSVIYSQKKGKNNNKKKSADLSKFNLEDLKGRKHIKLSVQIIKLLFKMQITCALLNLTEMRSTKVIPCQCAPFPH